jgi:hypothetical protein
MSGCGLFSTRNPENPDTGKSTFQPPTSADIVIANFINAIQEKNIDNYITCLTDSAQSTKNLFSFQPSSEANAKYAAIFQNWSIASEKSCMSNLFNNMPSDGFPVLNFTNSKFDVLLPDSAVYITDYMLLAKHNLTNIPTSFSGTMQLTIIRHSSGLWNVDRWIDLSSNSDSVKITWSILKAQFSY